MLKVTFAPDNHSTGLSDRLRSRRRRRRWHQTVAAASTPTPEADRQN
jgi:hypothetical protein